ncbi:hypothetical protein CC1G_14309 [Coprinopsis cinerea okayama7|uniref:Uncharacterized protein n=1 Tax=Coprinopsis cinerea (strain Okayama-7 / 130 / ATCC MYA-4618 / FGSC 9003) TaxID=240176 RepID=D6RLY9_COPC7|nr:hypothetical protein CC1G_14309 [Coprinopsis cinerea okayama7\|eukprot:XP_002911314.1 hypothetical protein CC1G_14309 [Coprinopsis cinerea okayama7\
MAHVYLEAVMTNHNRALGNKQNAHPVYSSFIQAGKKEGQRDKTNGPRFWE